MCLFRKEEDFIAYRVDDEWDRFPQTAVRDASAGFQHPSESNPGHVAAFVLGSRASLEEPIPEENDAGGDAVVPCCCRKRGMKHRSGFRSDSGRRLSDE